MKYINKCIDYFKSNIPLAITVGVIAAILIIAIIALCVKKARAKKAAKLAAKAQQAVAEQPAPVPEQETVEEPVQEPAPAQAAEVKEEVKEEKAEETPVAVVKEEKAEEKPAPAPAPAPAPKKKAAPKKAAVKEEKTVETKPAEKSEPVEKKAPAKKTESVKTQQPAPVSAPAPKKAAQKAEKTATRYNGKWVICRVLVAGENGNPIDETYFFELRASNGEKLLSSEEYTSYAGALGGIETHKANIERGNFKITPSKKGDYLFKLLNGKNMLLCMGEHYKTRVRCESAIESTKRFAATAVIDENVHDIIVPAPVDEDEPETKEIDNGYIGKWIIRKHKTEDEEVFYFELFASNGEKLISSEEYTTYAGAVNGIETHKTNIERGNFRVSFTKKGDFIFKLLNGNGQLLCLGEHYKTKSRCESAIESVKRFAKSAPVYAESDVADKK